MDLLKCIVLSFVCILGLLSCSSNEIYSSRVEVSEQWQYEDRVDFVFEIADTSQLYELILDIDHNTSYAYQNLYVDTQTTFPDATVKEAVVSLDIGSPKGGWRGDCSGERCTVNIGLQPNVKFQQLGTYKLSIAQHSREDAVEGIDAMTLRINKRTKQ